MIDRTKELKDVVDGRATWESPEPEEDMVIVDMQKLAEEDAEENKAVQQFQAECKNIEGMIEAMEERMDALEQQYGHSLDVTSAEKVKAVKDRIRQLIAETRRFAASTRAALSTMEQQTHDMKKQAEVEASETEGKSALIRMREQQHAFLTNRFASVLRDWEQIRDDYRRSCVERLARQIRIVNPNMSEKQVEQMLSKSEVETTEIFKTDWLLTKAQRAQLESVYAEVYETHKEIRELEQEFQELHQTFVDTSTLVSQQDELLDIIQLQVRNATEYVGKGRGHLAKAMKYQAKGRKKMVQIIVVCICIIGVVAVLGFVGGKFLVPTLIAQAKKASKG